jgi:hypothetical protein
VGGGSVEGRRRSPGIGHRAGEPPPQVSTGVGENDLRARVSGCLTSIYTSWTAGWISNSIETFLKKGANTDLQQLWLCSVPERGGMEWNGSVPRSRDGSDPVFGSEKNKERNGSIPVFGFGMGWEWNGIILNSIIYFLNWINYY